MWEDRAGEPVGGPAAAVGGQGSGDSVSALSQANHRGQPCDNPAKSGPSSRGGEEYLLFYTSRFKGESALMLLISGHCLMKLWWLPCCCVLLQLEVMMQDRNLVCSALKHFQAIGFRNVQRKWRGAFFTDTELRGDNAGLPARRRGAVAGASGGGGSHIWEQRAPV